MMREGVPSLLAIIIGTACVLFGGTYLLLPVLHHAPHSPTSDIIGALAMAFGFVCAIPANMQKAVAVFQPILPWGRRATDVGEAPSAGPPPGKGS
jgi:hypothetical protein